MPSPFSAGYPCILSSTPSGDLGGEGGLHPHAGLEFDAVGASADRVAAEILLPHSIHRPNLAQHVLQVEPGGADREAITARLGE